MLFDAHNHVHLGPSKLTNLVPEPPLPIPFGGIALMSTHPRDFDVVQSSCSTLSKTHGNFNAIPCFGVHPWFIHEMNSNNSNPESEGNTIGSDVPLWVCEMENLLNQNKNACVGEIGLDGARWTNPETRELSTPMEDQQSIFELQLQMASNHNRPVSIHVVHAWGPFFNSIKKVKQSKKCKGLPSKMYLHAFGGKPMVVNQVLKACGNSPKSKIFFGFAPCINFRSHRVNEVIKTVGMDRILLETDLEDGTRVYDDLCSGAKLIADALEISIDEVLERSYKNAQEFYGFND